MVPLLRRPRSLTALAALAAGLLLAVPAAASASSTDQAVAYQLDPDHDGYQTADPITTPLTQAWSVTLPGSISYPLIVNGVVYVTANVASGSGTTLYAIEQATGATLWSHPLGGANNVSGIVYDGGRVFALNNSGVLTAYDASTGTSDWSLTLPGATEFDNPPGVGDGFVYAGGGGGTGIVYAVSEETGALVWKTNDNGSDESAPVVTPTGVYVTYAGDEDYDFNPYTGAVIWHYNTGDSGGGGTTPVLANDEIFGRDSVFGNVILSADSGSDLGTFSSTYAPAAGGGVLYTASAGTLDAFTNWGLGSQSWSFSGDSHIDTAPLVDGTLVFEGSSSGELYALNASDGSTAWSTATGVDIPAPDERTSAQPLTGMGVGENTLIVPAGSTLLAYTGANVGSGIPAVGESPSVSGTPVATEAVGADVGVWTALPTAYTYQWSLCDSGGGNCSNISTNATGESYTPPDTDIGDTLDVTVTATNTSGTSSPVTSPPSNPIIEAQPANQTLPAISGTAPQVGDTLTASTGNWSNSPTSYDYQWMRCVAGGCAAIAGATSSTYVVADGDEDYGLAVTVTANNATGSAVATSTTTATVPALTTVYVHATPNPAAVGASVTLSAVLFPELNGGTLSITENGQAIPGCPPVATTVFLLAITCTGPFEQPGNYTITGTFSGTTGWLGDSASLTQVVTGTAPSAPAPVAVAIDGNPSSLVNSPVIKYTETGPVASTTCTMDGNATPCSSTQAAFTNLPGGHHTFVVTVTGAGASADAQVAWKITTSTSIAKLTGKKSKSHKKHKKKKKHKKPKTKKPKHKKPKTKKPKTKKPKAGKHKGAAA
jgi:outer membrane protein assembly factor BamB